MTHILKIDASSRTEGSHSRDLAAAFLADWLARHPQSRVTARDLARDPIPHISSETITGFYTPAASMDARLRQATALSDRLIAEIKAADLLLLSTPMYNFGLPSGLKAWIDQIVRIGHTFAYDGANFDGLLKGKSAVIACAYGAGGYLNGGPFAGADFVQPYLRFLLGFLGFADVAFIPVEATTADAATVAANMAAARQGFAKALAA